MAPLSGASPSKKITQLEAQLKKKPKSLKTRQKLGLLYYKSKKYKKCISTLNPQLDRIKKKSSLFLYQCFSKIKNYEGQITVIRHIIENFGETYKLRYDLGRALYQLKKYQESAVELKQSIKLSQKFKPAYKILIDIFMTEKNFYEARLLIEESIKLFGETPNSIVHLCTLYSKEGFLNETINVCEKAKKHKVATVSTFINLAIAYKDQEQLIEAKKTLLKASKRFPKNFEPREALGYYYLGKKSFTLSKKYFIKSIKLNHNSSDSHSGLAQSYFELKKYGLSLKSFNYACVNNQEAYMKIRNYTSLMRTEKNYKWISKFESQSRKCRFLSRKRQ